MIPRFSVYVAGSSAYAGEVLEQVTALQRCGVTVCSTWHRTNPSEWAGKDDRLDRDAQEMLARQCFTEVADCSVFWLIHTPGLRGALVELGRAQALGKPVIVSGRGCSESIFTACSDLRDADHGVALHEIVKLARDRQRAAAALGVQP